MAEIRLTFRKTSAQRTAYCAQSDGNKVGVLYGNPLTDVVHEGGQVDDVQEIRQDRHNTHLNQLAVLADKHCKAAYETHHRGGQHVGEQEDVVCGRRTG